MAGIGTSVFITGIGLRIRFATHPFTRYTSTLAELVHSSGRGYFNKH